MGKASSNGMKEGREQSERRGHREHCEQQSQRNMGSMRETG